MRAGFAWVGVIATLAASGCSVSPDPGAEGLVVIDGKEDGFGFEFGFFANDDFDWESPAPLMVAFHDVAEGLPEGYAGHFDYALYDPDGETTTLSSGVFQLYVQGEQTGLLLEGYDGQEIGRFPWSYEGRSFHLGDHRLSRRYPSDRPEVLGQCEALEVLDFELEESFTVWEYPSVDIESDGQGGFAVSLGSSGFESADGDTITVGTNDAGELEARVVTSYGDQILVQIPDARPSRGRVLYGSEGETPHLMASLVCYPPPAPSPGPQTTDFTCTTRRAEAEGQTATIHFTVVDLADHEALDLYWPDEVEEPISVEPNSSFAYTLVGGIADGYLTYTDGKLRLFTDQIGYEFGELELYENSGYQLGYFRFEMMDPDHTTFYTEVDCVLE